ncbi:MAG TPA: hypothetical protein VJW17_16875 [Pyrinomonadaceae bacterium]|nr:hypothetical protein [Pyrinomonadaceae bacterium]
MWRSILLVIGCGLLLITSGRSAANQRAVSTVFALVEKRVDTKSARVNQEVTLRTINDVIVAGQVVIPSGSRLVGHVVEFATTGKGNPQTILAIVVDKALVEGEREITLEAIIAAVAAAPQDGSLTSDPTYGMMHSNEPKMIAPGPSSSSRSGELSPSSKVESTATIGTARINGGMRNGLLLNAESEGAIGFPGLTLSWRLDTPPAVTVFSSSGKEIKFEAGTQVLLRMAPPQRVVERE